MNDRSALFLAHCNLSLTGPRDCGDKGRTRAREQVASYQDYRSPIRMLRGLNLERTLNPTFTPSETVRVNLFLFN